MAGGFFSGLVWGTMLSGFVGAGISVYHSEYYSAQNGEQNTERSGMTNGAVASQKIAPKAAGDNAVSASDSMASDVEKPTDPVQETSPTKDTPSEDNSNTPAQNGPEPAADAPPAPVREIKNDPQPPKEAEVLPDLALEKPETGIAQVKPEDGSAPQTPRTGNGQTETGETKEQAAPEVMPNEMADKPADKIMKPVPGITNMAPQIETGRLPSIGAEPDTKTNPADETGSQSAQVPVAPSRPAGALAANSARFENPRALPVMSIILIDTPNAPIADDVLENLPFSVSFAIDAVREDATQVASRYRKAGFEVLMLTNLPLGAGASEIEIAFQAYARAVPEAVAVLDLGANGFLRGPSTATHIAGILSDGGFGLITPSKGLNTAQKVAMREGVPAALIFRQLDSDAEKPSVIRRYLDRAAFRAKQEGHVIMLGHTRAQTIEALVQWSLEDRAASVAIGPVSAVLKELQ